MVKHKICYDVDSNYSYRLYIEKSNMNTDYVGITGYHGTSSRHAESIAKNGLDPDKTHERPNHWLGQGVYFYENFGLAKWWANDIAGKAYNYGSFPIVYRAQIEASKEDVLDLDDYRQYDLFLGRLLDMQKEIESDDCDRMPIFNPEQQRAVYFDYYRKMYHIAVIMFTFSKDCAKYGTFRSDADLLQQKKLEKALGLAYHEKQICVSRKECIKSIEVQYTGEDEVI